mgnify:CR=1 FL=1
MACDLIDLPGGGRAIFCSSRKRQLCDECGRAATLLCDWKVSERRSGTCDRPICRTCATSPAPEKDLCPEHARAFADWRHQRANHPLQSGADHDA